MRRRAEYVMQAIKRSALCLLLLASGTSCTKYDPLYCDESTSCTDPARPYCDLAGEYPASDGVARTCIPSPFDAGGLDAGSGGGTDADGSADQPDAGARRDAAVPCSWAPLTRLANVNTSDGYEYAGSLDSAGLKLLFSRFSAETGDGLFVATRESVGEVFEPPVRIDELSDNGDDPTDPELSSSGREIFFVGTNSVIETSTRSSQSGTFGTPEPTGLTGVSPSLSGDGLHLYFIETSNNTVQRAARTAIGEPWGPPESVLPATGYSSIDISPDELHLVLDRLTPPPETAISIADRSSTEEDFGAPIPVNEELLIPDVLFYIGAHLDGSRTLMVVSAAAGPNTDLFYSVCD